MTTKLAFQNQTVTIAAGGSEYVGIVDVEPFERIRVVAFERIGSAGPVVIRLTITEGTPGHYELIAQLDTPILQPHSQFTEVYEVPGTKLSIFADATGTSGSSSVAVLVYGSASK